MLFWLIILIYIYICIYIYIYIYMYVCMYVLYIVQISNIACTLNVKFHFRPSVIRSTWTQIKWGKIKFSNFVFVFAYSMPLRSLFMTKWPPTPYSQTVPISPSLTFICSYILHSILMPCNKEIYGVNLRIQSKCGKIRTRKTPNTDIFQAVHNNVFHSVNLTINTVTSICCIQKMGKK